MMQAMLSSGHAPAKRLLLTVSLLFLASAQIAFATNNKDAIEACRTDLQESEAATEFRDFRVSHHHNVPFVYGTVDFADIKGIHVRCRIYKGTVKELRYLVRDPGVTNGRGWSKSRPHGEIHEGLELDEAAQAPPPKNAPSPHFIRVPQD